MPARAGKGGLSVLYTMFCKPEKPTSCLGECAGYLCRHHRLGLSIDHQDCKLLRQYQRPCMKCTCCMPHSNTSTIGNALAADDASYCNAHCPMFHHLDEWWNTAMLPGLLTRHNKGRAEGQLLVLIEEVVGVLVQHHAANRLQGEQVLGPDLGHILQTQATLRSKKIYNLKQPSGSGKGC